MKKRMLMNLILAVLVSGLFLTVSCAKKTVVSEPTTIEDQTQAQKDQADAERIRQQKLDEQMAKEQAMKDAVAMARKNFVNQDVLFAYDSSELDSASMALLKVKAEWLMANPGQRATVEGHCDERGTTEYNLALGERRAAVVKAYLVNLGVSSSRLSTISYGEEQPIATGASEGAYRLNRRAHFAID